VLAYVYGQHWLEPMNISKYTQLFILTVLLLVGCTPAGTNKLPNSPRLDAARNIVAAVNAKASEQYVRDLHEDVIVTMYDGGIRLRGKQAIQANRENHFKTYPTARNELVHLVEIDNQVVMHDKVWLKGDESKPADIVEIFSFDGDKIIRIDVIQAAGLLDDP